MPVGKRKSTRTTSFDCSTTPSLWNRDDMATTHTSHVRRGTCCLFIPRLLRLSVQSQSLRVFPGTLPTCEFPIWSPGTLDHVSHCTVPVLYMFTLSWKLRAHAPDLRTPTSMNMINGTYRNSNFLHCSFQILLRHAHHL